jgi:hypothetical protein
MTSETGWPAARAESSVSLRSECRLGVQQRCIEEAAKNQRAARDGAKCAVIVLGDFRHA